MGKRRDWSKVGEVVEKTRELGLSYQEGAKRFGVRVRDLYDYNERRKREKAEVEGKTTEPSSPQEVPTERKDRGAQLPEEVQHLLDRLPRPIGQRLVGHPIPSRNTPRYR